MKKFKDISEFEDLLKDNLQGHSTPAPPDVWSSVAASTAQSAGILSQATSFLRSTTNLLKVALFAGGIAAVGIVVYNENNKPEDVQTSVINDRNSAESNIPTLEIQSEDTLQEEASTNSEKNIEKSTPEKVEESEISKKKEMPTPDGKKQDVNSDNEHLGTAQNGSETPISPSQLNKPNEGLAKDQALTIQVSNTQPCIGDQVVLTANKPVKWHAGSTPLGTEPTLSATYTCTNTGSLTIRGGDQKVMLQVTDIKSSITVSEDKTTQEYTASLKNADQLANWYVNDEIVATNTSSISYIINEVGTHIIKAKIINQPCASDAEYVVSISPIGKIKTWDIFTPNGDGKNDTYTVDISGYENYSIQIVDAQNRLLFFSTDPENGWNGRVENVGNECASGYYVAKISYTLKGEKPDTKNVRFRLQRS